MKKGLVILVVLVMIVSSSVMAFAWDANAPAGRPVIDGKVDAAWASADTLKMSVNETADFSGTAKVMWDTENLYFLFEIKDKTLCAAGELQHNDSVEVWINQAHEQNDRRAVGNDLFARVDINNKVTYTDDESVRKSGTTSAVVKGDGGYVVEMAVKRDVATPADGIIGVEVSANTDDNNDGERDFNIAGSTKNYWVGPDQYSNLKLTGTAPAATENPKTGDSMSFLYLAMAALVVGGICVMTLRKKADAK